MSLVGIFFLKLKNTLRYKHNLILLTALPLLAAAGAWALLTFYIEGGANIPVGILDYDKSEFSELAISRFSEKASVGTRILDTGDIALYSAAEQAGDGVPAGAEEGGGGQSAEGGAGEGGGEEGGGEEGGDGGAMDLILKSDEYTAAARLVQTGALECVVIVSPGFSDKIKGGVPEGLFSVICHPSGVTRGLVAELFAAQVSRIYFNCDSANRVVRESVLAARQARKPALTEREKAEIYEMAFGYYDSYWEPEPLMTVNYVRYDAANAATAQTDGALGADAASPAGAAQTSGAQGAGAIRSTDAAQTSAAQSMASARRTATGSAIPGSDGGWLDLRDMLNDLLSRAVFAIFFTYAAFCIVNAAGAMTAEREDGVLTRMKAHGFGAAAWIAVSAAAPFILYGIPCSALIAYLFKDRGNALISSATINSYAAFNASAAFNSCVALLCISAIGATVAYILKKPGRYRIFALASLFLSAGISLYIV